MPTKKTPLKTSLNTRIDALFSQQETTNQTQVMAINLLSLPD